MQSDKSVGRQIFNVYFVAIHRLFICDTNKKYMNNFFFNEKLYETLKHDCEDKLRVCVYSNVVQWQFDEWSFQDVTTMWGKSHSLPLNVYLLSYLRGLLNNSCEEICVNWFCQIESFWSKCFLPSLKLVILAYRFLMLKKSSFTIKIIFC